MNGPTARNWKPMQGNCADGAAGVECLYLPQVTLVGCRMEDGLDGLLFFFFPFLSPFVSADCALVHLTVRRWRGLMGTIDWGASRAQG